MKQPYIANYMIPSKHQNFIDTGEETRSNECLEIIEDETVTESVEMSNLISYLKNNTKNLMSKVNIESTIQTFTSSDDNNNDILVILP